MRIYRGARRAMKVLITKSKEKCWRELCEEVERDPWGMGYKIVRKKLGVALPRLPREQVAEIVEKLFPRHTIEGREQIDGHSDFPSVSEDEVKAAGRTPEGGQGCRSGWHPTGDRQISHGAVPWSGEEGGRQTAGGR